LSVLFFPEFYKSLPSWTHQFTASEITVAVVVSTILNALFLLGTWRYSQLRLGAGETPLTAASFDVFFDKQGADWKIPAVDFQRVRGVVDQAIEHVAANAQGPCNSGSEAIASTSRLHSATWVTCRIFPMLGRDLISWKSRALLAG
jgi:hypothetical protein